ncbi:putative DNA-binding domain-containing protein [Stenotrophomonas sp.]|uniref:HvfC family RiPP maturation protein n=1 Tax=Stenotrophomonas sp. TaxID=69392 RepID=UPI0028A0A7FE|nr:putative DNA-binding domain-containing protein [Stenotrophomonas sp.]
MSVRLREQQHALTAHLRDPLHQPAPEGLDETRLQVYRDLLFNNLRALLAGSFPVLQQVLQAEEWDGVCRRYFVEHRCVSPLFTEVAAEFVAWLQDAPGLPRAFLAELAHYEWVEQALQGSADQPLPAPSTALDPWQEPLRVSPLAWALGYRWPVHRLGADHQPAHPPAQPTFLLARRVAGGEVVFSELSALAWQLLEQMGDGPARSGRDHLQVLALEQGLQPAQIETNGRALLAQMLSAGVIGTA